jgi:hypothetical protein
MKVAIKNQNIFIEEINKPKTSKFPFFEKNAIQKVVCKTALMQLFK